MVRRPLLEHPPSSQPRRRCLQHVVHGSAGSLKSCLEVETLHHNLTHDKDKAEALKELSHVRRVSTRRDQAAAEDAVRQMLIGKHMDGGVSFRDPGSTHISLDVTIGRDSAIGIGVQLLGKTTIGRRVCA